MTVIKATCKDGRPVEFVLVDDPPAGGMKKTYFSPDRSYVVQFFHDQTAGEDPQRLARLDFILGKYNPTIPEAEGGARGVTKASAEYFKRLFCWPTGIVVQPQIGIVAPTYPGNFFFDKEPLKGIEKQGGWFIKPKPRSLLPNEERGTLVSYLQLCILMARAVRRLHAAGLAHSDLSCTNILVDPSRGQCVVIDIDSLVVPRLFPPDVAGTPGYIAPEVLSTMPLDLRDPLRILPSSRTDQHALPVLIYEYLLLRHPLDGPKINSGVSTEEDQNLSMGAKALFVENPNDTSNRPPDLDIPCSELGPHLQNLFMKAFVNGLHSPDERPSASDWEYALVKTFNMLYPCANPACSRKWFVLYDQNNVRCPFCQTKPTGTIPIFRLRKESRPGQWLLDSQVVVYNGFYLFKWHCFDDVFPGEEADRTPQAYCQFHQGQWILVNQHLNSLTSATGNRVAPGQYTALQDGAQIRLSQEPHGRIAEVQMIQLP
jgi:serine/threonine protein kinase